MAKADTTRAEVAFIRWDIPSKKQTDLPDELRYGEAARMNREHTVLTALNPTAGILFEGEPVPVDIVLTSGDGGDGERRRITNPRNGDTETVCTRAYLVKVLQAMDSDWVKLKVDPVSGIISVMGMIDDRDAAAVIAPRVEDRYERTEDQLRVPGVRQEVRMVRGRQGDPPVPLDVLHRMLAHDRHR